MKAQLFSLFALLIGLLPKHTHGQSSVGNHPFEVKILVAYTPSALQAMNGQLATANSIYDAVDDLNEALLNSEVTHFVKLVRVIGIDFQESSDFYDNVHRFSILPQIASLRSRYSADLAILVLNNPSKCGLPLILDEVAASNTAFCAVHWECMKEAYGLSHMVGHLFGAGHLADGEGSDQEVDEDTLAQSAYAHGFQWSFLDTDVGFTTIMGQYDDFYCTDEEMPLCYIAPYFSNPNVMFSGVPTGQEGIADNARVINDNASILAGFYPMPTTTATYDTVQNMDLALLGGRSTVKNSGDHYWIKDQARVQFRAASKITLEPGFKVEEGAYFETLLDSAILDMR